MPTTHQLNNNMSDFIVVKVFELCFLFDDFLTDLTKGNFTRIIAFENFIKDQQFILDFAGIEHICDDKFNDTYGVARYDLIELFNTRFDTGISGLRAGVLAVRDVWLEIVRQNTLRYMAEDSVIEDNTTVRFDSDVRSIKSSFSSEISVSVVNMHAIYSSPETQEKESGCEDSFHTYTFQSQFENLGSSSQYQHLKEDSVTDMNGDVVDSPDATVYYGGLFKNLNERKKYEAFYVKEISTMKLASKTPAKSLEVAKAMIATLQKENRKLRYDHAVKIERLKRHSHFELVDSICSLKNRLAHTDDKLLKSEKRYQELSELVSSAHHYTCSTQLGDGDDE